MADPVITNVDIGGVGFGDASFRPETLNLSGAQTIALGTILARDSVSGKLVLYVPGGQAIKSTSDGTFNLAPGDTMVINTNAAGNETVTFDAAAATITDTTTYAVTDQDGKTMTVTLTGGPWDGVVQTVTFSGVTTANTAVASQMNTQLDGCSVEVTGGQVKITHDGKGTGMDIATGAGTGDLTWAASVAGTGDVADISAVTATEVKTVTEADTTDLTVTVSGLAAVFTATTSIQFVSGLALAKLGLSVETVNANENGIPKAVLTYELAGANGDNVIRALVGGEVRDSKLVINDGTSLTDPIRDLLRNYGIMPIDIKEIGELDNQ
jgi:hypothetical protein